MVVDHMMGINFIKSSSEISGNMMRGMPPSGWIALTELSFPTPYFFRVMMIIDGFCVVKNQSGLQ